MTNSLCSKVEEEVEEVVEEEAVVAGTATAEATAGRTVDRTAGQTAEAEAAAPTLKGAAGALTDRAEETKAGAKVCIPHCTHPPVVRSTDLD
jgi:hypothetical protein